MNTNYTQFDDILQEIKEVGYFPRHNGYDNNVYKALDKLKAFGLIESNASYTTYKFSKDGHLLIKSGKTFDMWINPRWDSKLWNFITKNLWPAILTAFRMLWPF